ncbi:transposable element Tcb1 transposase [Trichonephila clavipes]|nr:transposable element Tcb1 transposase [Trichonephila clavipes]
MEHSIRPVLSALFCYRYNSFKADHVQTLGHIVLYAQCNNDRPHLPPSILEQHVRLFRGTIGAEFPFMDNNTRPQRANIVDECLQSEGITRMDWPAFSTNLNPIEHVWDMLGRRIAARQPPPTCLPKLRRTLLDEWYKIPQDQIDNLILSMPRRSVATEETGAKAADTPQMHTSTSLPYPISWHPKAKEATVEKECYPLSEGKRRDLRNTRRKLEGVNTAIQQRSDPSKSQKKVNFFKKKKTSKKYEKIARPKVRKQRKRDAEDIR